MPNNTHDGMVSRCLVMLGEGSKEWMAWEDADEDGRQFGAIKNIFKQEDIFKELSESFTTKEIVTIFSIIHQEKNRKIPKVELHIYNVAS